MPLTPRTRSGSFLSLILLGLLACDATFTVGYPTATMPPPSEMPTVTPPSLALTLTSVAFNENNASPPSSISAQIPQLTGSDDARVTAFNQAVNQFIMAEIEAFKNGLVGMSMPPMVAVSTFDAKYHVVHQGGDVWSLRFDLTIYADGAAHPGDLVRTFNYDFAHSQVLHLDDLFLPASPYLEVISAFCSAELSARELGFNETTVGAEPSAENYRSWNITPAGLVITFERGQIAAYAAPAQEVVIPFVELKTLLDPQGPLAGWVK